MISTRVLSTEPNGRDAALVVGNFDGVHRGHQELIAYNLGLAERHDLRPVVMTFEPHPAVALGGAPPPVLTKMDRKIELLRSMAPDLEVIVERFDREFAQLLPVEFVERILVGDLHVRQLVVGSNFRFGRDRAGTVEQLDEFGARFGFVAHAFNLAGDAQGSYSSSRIRRLLKEGELTDANWILGRPHAVTGKVVQGDGRGRSIGVPTANLADIEELVPLDGVYAGQVEMIDQGAAQIIGAAVVHVGPRPTVERGFTVEAHVIDRSLDLYGKHLRIGFWQRLRGLERFNDLESLRRQIEQDIAAARLVPGLAAS
jgi:riboflavin kinase / FMN adenylyltransferase